MARRWLDLRDGWVEQAMTAREAEVVLVGLSCTHPRMRCPNNLPPLEAPCRNPRCGHLACPDCGLSWDEGFDGFPGEYQRKARA